MAAASSLYKFGSSAWLPGTGPPTWGGEGGREGGREEEREGGREGGHSDWQVNRDR